MGRTECLTWVDYERAVVGTALFSESEMAFFSERTHTYAQKTLDTADIVREAMLRQLLQKRNSASDPVNCLVFRWADSKRGDGANRQLSTSRVSDQCVGNLHSLAVRFQTL